MTPAPLVSACKAIEATLDAECEIRGTWLSTDCLPDRLHGGYADFYSFNNPLTQDVKIELDYTDDYINTYLYLVRGTDIWDNHISFNNDRPVGTNSRIERGLLSGDYVVVATTFGKTLTTGDYRLVIAPKNAGCGVTAIEDEVTTGSWTVSDCKATRRVAHYADYYTVTVGEPARAVEIKLESETDPYLILIEGGDPSGTDYIADDDDSAGNRNARIIETLTPGTYTVAATTYGWYKTGDYTLTVRGNQ